MSRRGWRCKCWVSFFFFVLRKLCHLRDCSERVSTKQSMCMVVRGSVLEISSSSSKSGYKWSYSSSGVMCCTQTLSHFNLVVYRVRILMMIRVQHSAESLNTSPSFYRLRWKRCLLSPLKTLSGILLRMKYFLIFFSFIFCFYVCCLSLPVSCALHSWAPGRTGRG